MIAGRSDTSPQAQAVFDRLNAELTDAQRLRQMCAMNETLRQLARARILAQYGPMPEPELVLRVAATAIRRELMVKAFGWDPEIQGW